MAGVVLDPRDDRQVVAAPPVADSGIEGTQPRRQEDGIEAQHRSHPWHRQRAPGRERRVTARVDHARQARVTRVEVTGHDEALAAGNPRLGPGRQLVELRVAARAGAEPQGGQ